MNKTVKKTLRKITKENEEAYIVGGFVRDYLLGIKSYDVDICTSFDNTKLAKIFQTGKVGEYNSFKMQIGPFNIDITTFRNDIKYKCGKLVLYETTNDLKSDLRRRDFTINAICMDKSGQILDYFHGLDDLKKRKIRTIGDPLEKIQEDPSRILRAIRLCTTLNFTLDAALKESITNNLTLISFISNQKWKIEFDKILNSQNYQIGLKYFQEFHINSHLDYEYQNMIYVDNLYGMYAQFTKIPNLPFTKQERKNIIDIRQIVEHGIIDNEILYKYGLEKCLIAAEILQINKNSVQKQYSKLPIYKDKDLKITNKEIITILDGIPSDVISDLKNTMITQILNNKLKNNRKILKKFVKESSVQYET